MTIISNEFATVEVEVDYCANGPRVKLEDFRSGSICYLDPLEIVGIIAMDSSERLKWLDPSRLFSNSNREK